MNADAIRYLYNYHFAMNHKLWEKYILPLPQEQFVREVIYSHGSVRNQVVHLMNAEAMWFSELHGGDPKELGPEMNDRDLIREHWDAVEETMRQYLDSLRDDMLLTQPITEPEEDKVLYLWQVLIHVVNHATDHRAQTLRLLNDLGVKTEYQDFIFYIYDHPS